jgi:23S rRNA pseudouridine2605 synthase
VEPSRITSRRPPQRQPLPDEDDARSAAKRRLEALDDGLERLQKVLAAAGLGSRRTCEELITSGRVEIDRQVVTLLGTRIDPLKSEVRVDGEKLPNPKRVVYMLNKPVGVVTTNFDPSGRPRVVDLVPGEQRLFAIGRLDRMSEGLILVTNDGALANLLSHPRYGVEKKYLVQVAGVPSQELLDKIRRGITLADGKVHAKRVDIRSQHKQSAVLEMILDEGKNREIRRMLARLGHKVHQLKRVGVGKLSLGNLLPSQWRQLAWSEIEALRHDAIAAVGPIEAERMNDPIPDERAGRPGRSGRPGRDGGPGRGPAGPPRPPRVGQGAPRGTYRDQGQRSQGTRSQGTRSQGTRSQGTRSVGTRGQGNGNQGSRLPAGKGVRPRSPAGQGTEQEPRRPAGRPPRRPRKPGKASSWRKPRGE